MSKNEVFQLINDCKSSCIAVSGSAGTGKTLLALDWACDLIKSHYQDNLNCKHIHELEHLLNEGLGMLVLTSDFGYSFLHKLSEKLFPKDKYDFHPVAATYNICKVIGKSLPVEEVENYIISKKIKYLILDNYQFDHDFTEGIAGQSRMLQNFLSFCRTQNITVIILSSTRENLSSTMNGSIASGLGYKLAHICSLHLKTNKIEVTEESKIKLTIEVLKYRSGKSGITLEYETAY